MGAEHLGFAVLRLKFHFCARLHTNTFFFPSVISTFCLLNVSSRLNITISDSEKKDLRGKTHLTQSLSAKIVE